MRAARRLAPCSRASSIRQRSPARLPNTAPSAQTKATALAQAFVTKGTASLPSNITVKSTVIAPGAVGSGNKVAYTMSVTVTASVPTTLMSLFMRTMNITVFAAAKNPVVTMTVDTTGFTSSACDANSLYWYVVPANGGVPDANTLSNVVWANTSSGNPNTVSITVAASLQIGFAFKNATGGRPSSLGGCTYGNNTYGSRNGDTQRFYSHLIPPNCAALSGNSFLYAFNDMGGASDDYDYNDLVFNLQCSGGSGAGTGTTTTGVILTD